MNPRILLATVLLLAAPRAIACQCGERPSLEEALKKRDLVVTGVVLRQDPAAISRERVRYAVSDSNLPRVLPVTKITIGVTRVFKGDPADTITLTHIGCCVCEKGLETGKEYLLFVPHSWEVDGARGVTFCDPNIELAGGNLPAGLPSALRVRASRRFNDSLGAKLRRGGDQLANMYGRFLVTRLGPNYWYADPLQQLREWPWLPVSVAVVAGLVVGPIAVFLRRRHMRRRDGG